MTLETINRLNVINKQIECNRRKCVLLIKIPENSPNGIRAPEGPKQGVLDGVVTKINNPMHYFTHFSLILALLSEDRLR